MQALAEITLPVFLVLGLGWVAVWRGLMRLEDVEGLMRFAQNFAIPALLFTAVAKLDIGSRFDLGLLVSYYGGSLTVFAAGSLGARYLFGRAAPDAVAVGFIAMFGNSVLLGLPIGERAYGAGVVEFTVAILAIHAPFCYLVGITAMEVVLAGPGSIGKTVVKVARSMATNALMIGIALGFVVNLTGLPIPTVIAAPLDLLARAALPAALFALGGVLYRYRPEGDVRLIAYTIALKLGLHPTIALLLGTQVFDLAPEPLRAAVVTATVASGVNAYLFAHMYGRAQRVAASAVLVGTVITLFTATGWLVVLGPL